MAQFKWKPLMEPVVLGDGDGSLTPRGIDADKFKIPGPEDLEGAHHPGAGTVGEETLSSASNNHRILHKEMEAAIMGFFVASCLVQFWFWRSHGPLPTNREEGHSGLATGPLNVVLKVQKYTTIKTAMPFSNIDCSIIIAI